MEHTRKFEPEELDYIEQNKSIFCRIVELEDDIKAMSHSPHCMGERLLYDAVSELHHNVENKYLHESLKKLGGGRHKWSSFRKIVEPMRAKLSYRLAENGWADSFCTNCGYWSNHDVQCHEDWVYCPACGMKFTNGGK